MWSAIAVLEAGTRPHYVYFILADGDPNSAVKIGTTVDVYGRLAALRNDDTKRPPWVKPETLRLIGFVEGDHELERLLHCAFRDERLLGEWFDYVSIQDQIDEILYRKCKCRGCEYGDHFENL